MINTENTLGIEVSETASLKEVGINDLKFTNGIEYELGKSQQLDMFSVKLVAPEYGTIFYDRQKSTSNSLETTLYEANTYLRGHFFIRLQGLRNEGLGTSHIHFYKNGVPSGVYTATQYATYDIDMPMNANDKISIKGKVSGGGVLRVEIIISGGLTFYPLYD